MKNTMYAVVPASPWMLNLLVQADKEHFGKKAWDELNWRGLLSLSADRNEKELVLAAIERLGPRQVRIHGFSVWAPDREKPNTMKLLKVAVQKSSRRNRIGMMLVNLPWSRPFAIHADVSERNLTAQQFFRGCGWEGRALGKLDGNGTIRFFTVGNCDEDRSVDGDKGVELEPLYPEESESRAEKSKLPKEKN